jgi:hypothetical protein
MKRITASDMAVNEKRYHTINPLAHSALRSFSKGAIAIYSGHSSSQKIAAGTFPTKVHPGASLNTADPTKPEAPIDRNLHASFLDAADVP